MMRLCRTDGRLCVESVCVLCGAHIIGSITETLLQDEAEHFIRCRGYMDAARNVPVATA